MMRTYSGGYVAKVPGAPGHLCPRCAMTRENREHYAAGCPLAAPVADLCPFLDEPTRERLRAMSLMLAKGPTQ